MDYFLKLWNSIIMVEESKNDVWRTDWLATKPVFYNIKTKKISYKVNDVIDTNDIEFHHSGFNNYLETGYSVFGQTPVNNVKFLLPHSEIQRTERRELIITELPDPVDQYINYKLSESDIIDLIQEKLINWEKNIDGTITIPLSGGYDSRLLTYLLPNKSKIRTYTYGISPKQEESFEVVVAKSFCEKLNIQWKQIKLGRFHKYFYEWNQIFGISTHSHGMYHIEFYKKIMTNYCSSEYNLLSGIGGTWATWKKSLYPEIKSIDDINTLLYTVGMNADPKFSKLLGNTTLISEYFWKNYLKLKDPRRRKIEMMRFIMHHLSYLLRIPESLGMKTYAPLLDIDIAMAMLNIPEDRRSKKKWLLEYFQNNGLDFSNLVNKRSKKNTLNYQALITMPPPPLNRAVFDQIIKGEYIDWINRNLTRFSKIENFYWDFTRLPKINRIFKMANIVDQRKSAYFAYLTLKPFEYLFNQRNQ